MRGDTFGLSVVFDTMFVIGPVIPVFLLRMVFLVSLIYLRTSIHKRYLNPAGKVPRTRVPSRARNPTVGKHTKRSIKISNLNLPMNPSGPLKFFFHPNLNF